MRMKTKTEERKFTQADRTRVVEHLRRVGRIQFDRTIFPQTFSSDGHAAEQPVQQRVRWRWA